MQSGSRLAIIHSEITNVILLKNKNSPELKCRKPLAQRTKDWTPWHDIQGPPRLLLWLSLELLLTSGVSPREPEGAGHHQAIQGTTCSPWNSVASTDTASSLRELQKIFSADHRLLSASSKSIQLTLEQHGSELCRPTYTWISFNSRCYSATWFMAGWIQQMQNHTYRGTTKQKTDCKVTPGFSTAWRVGITNPCIVGRISCIPNAILSAWHIMDAQ